VEQEILNRLLHSKKFMESRPSRDRFKVAHPHRFRHTMACELLLSGASLKSVAQILGHKSERITEKHYGSWVKGKQEKLEADVRKSWLVGPS